MTWTETKYINFEPFVVQYPNVLSKIYLPSLWAPISWENELHKMFSELENLTKTSDNKYSVVTIKQKFDWPRIYIKVIDLIGNESYENEISKKYEGILVNICVYCAKVGNGEFSRYCSDCKILRDIIK